MQRKDPALVPLLEAYTDQLDDLAGHQRDNFPIFHERDVLCETVPWRVAREGGGELVNGFGLEGGDLGELGFELDASVSCAPFF